MLGEKIRTQREKTNLTQKNLAELVNVSQQTIGSWEVGRTDPDTETIKILANLFGVSTDYLLDNEEKIANNYNKEYERLITSIVTEITDLNLSELANLECYIEFIKFKRKK